MLAQDYLTLGLVRLKAPEVWTAKEDGLSFLLVKGGVGKGVFGSTTQPLATGDVLVLDATSGCKVSVSGGGEMLFWCFAARFEHFFPLLASNEISLLRSVMDPFKAPKFYPASSTPARECHRLVREVPPQFTLDHRSQLLRVMAAILTVEFQQGHTQRAGFVRIEDHLIQVFEKLSSAELLTSSVGELAAKFGCSRRHLNRLFHQHFGISVAGLRMEMRLLKAVSLLRDPDAKVIRVAEECGFNHLGLFNTCFKKRFGTSPGQWRNMNSQAPTQPASLPGSDSTVCPLRLKGICPMSAESGNSHPAPNRAAQFPSGRTSR